METLKLLMVDDSADDRELFARLLRRNTDWALDYREAGDGAEAAALLGASMDLDVVLLDLKLPGDSGLQLLRAWGENYPQLPAVILLTGHGDERVAVEAMKHGAFDYLSKHDCTPEELIHAVWHAALVTRLRRELGQFQGLPALPASADERFHSGETAGVRRAVATLLHEINSPLTGITNSVLLLLEDELTEITRAILLEVLGACRRIEHVMHSMENLAELRSRTGHGAQNLLDLN